MRLPVPSSVSRVWPLGTALASVLLLGACGDAFTSDGVVIGPALAPDMGSAVSGNDVSDRDGESWDTSGLDLSAPPDAVPDEADPDGAAEDIAEPADVTEDSVADDELDGDELDGDELDGDELDGDELDGDELDGGEPPVCVCPPGSVCFDAGTDAAPVCAVDPAFACAPCVASATCLGGECTAQADGSFCQIPCTLGVLASSCPEGFLCAAQGPQGALRCIPSTGGCSCTAKNLGQVKSCGAAGACLGTATCGPSGWSPCTGAAPSPEVCNSLDDDCNGLTDEGLAGQACALAPGPLCQGLTTCDPPGGGLGCSAVPAGPETCDGEDNDCDGSTDEELADVGTPCEASNSVGTCTGVWTCYGKVGQICSAALPKTEACNGQDDDCDGLVDEDFAPTGQYLSVQHCGGCNKACAKPSGAHAVALCEAATVPSCTMACEAGWVDLGGGPANGCECLFIGAWDEPDGVDQNCDGMDGDAQLGVFVSKTGADGNPGTRTLPVASIAKALQIAAEKGKRDIYLAGGVYAGSVELMAGVSLYGGYGPGWANRDTVQYQSAIVGIASEDGPSWALRCKDINGPGQPTHVDGLTVLAANAKASGQSSYGLLSIGCDDRLQVSWNQISAGDGAAGLAGDPGQNGAIGANGKPGAPAKDIGKDVCTSADHNPGGKGGQGLCGGLDTSGGQGGTAICPQMDEDNPAPQCPSKPFLQALNAAEIGQNGHNAGGGDGGQAGADSYIDSNKGVVTSCKGTISCNTCLVPVKPRDGEDGLSGLPGPNGEGGLGGDPESAGSVTGGVWAPAMAGTGGSGLAGSGGGGGGAAGGVEVHDCGQSSSQYSDIGGSGGGGGAGGCGGTGGLGGLAGGASFAVLLVAGPTGKIPVFYGNSLSSGSGGAGAPGGPAGSGGGGGEGSPGGPSAEGESKTFCTSKGGNGGIGGAGGHGGGGGGGAGGPSALLVSAGFEPGTLQPLLKSNLLKSPGKGGSGGAGGPSIGQTGWPGAKGQSKTWWEL